MEGKWELRSNKRIKKISKERRVSKNAAGYFNSEQLCKLQIEQDCRGIIGANLIKTIYGWSVRYDSGLQNFGVLASARCKEIDGSLEAAISWARNWVAQDPHLRYAWMRKGEL